MPAQVQLTSETGPDIFARCAVERTADRRRARHKVKQPREVAEREASRRGRSRQSPVSVQESARPTVIKGDSGPQRLSVVGTGRRRKTFVDLAVDDPRWDAVFPVLHQLRGHLTRSLLDQVLVEGYPQGLRFTAILDAGRCKAVAGWRVVTNTSSIRKLYIDDLVTVDVERSGGYGRALLDELVRRACDLGCFQLDLDSGVQRHAAHRFYLRERMHIAAYHFIRQVHPALNSGVDGMS